MLFIVICLGSTAWKCIFVSGDSLEYSTYCVTVCLMTAGQIYVEMNIHWCCILSVFNNTIHTRMCKMNIYEFSTFSVSNNTIHTHMWKWTCMNSVYCLYPTIPFTHEVYVEMNIRWFCVLSVSYDTTCTGDMCGNEHSSCILYVSYDTIYTKDVQVCGNVNAVSCVFFDTI